LILSSKCRHSSLASSIPSYRSEGTAQSATECPHSSTPGSILPTRVTFTPCH
jgi:hypothetical protein